MQTSYFANMKGVYGENLVSISLKTPDGFKGPSYIKLAPKYDLLCRYKNGECSKNQYIIEYKRTILDKLNVHDEYKRLGSDAIICCYEKSGDFCHRHIVAMWFKEAGYSVEEYVK